MILTTTGKYIYYSGSRYFFADVVLPSDALRDHEIKIEDLDGIVEGIQE